MDAATHTIEVDLSEFAYDALRVEAEREGVTVEEIVAHALMYYLADADSGRMSRRFPRKAPPASDSTAPADS